jgi:hypothetical protein
MGVLRKPTRYKVLKGLTHSHYNSISDRYTITPMFLQEASVTQYLIELFAVRRQAKDS